MRLLEILFLPCLASAMLPSKLSCTIVGAGPAGLTLALALNKLSIFERIDILERRSALAAETTKAYLYLLDGRSKEVLELVNVWNGLKELAVSSKKFTHVNEISKSGVLKKLNIPIDATAEEKLWLPREALIGALVAEVQSANNSHIALHYNNSATYETIAEGRDCVVFDASGYRSEIVSNLLDQGRLSVYERESDSAGLQYKILSIDAAFSLPSGDASDCESSYVFRSKQSNLNLGLLPVKRSAISSTGKRTANVIMRKDSALWRVKDPQELRSYLSERFPQLAGATLASLVSSNEAERFVLAPPGVFPKPRCISPLYDFESNSNRLIAICGDAAHAFPPDIGQGVNAALEDVLCLYTAAKASAGADFDLLTLGRAYDASRRRSHRALIDIMAVAFPYQYNQSAFKKQLAYLNFALRLALNKVCPFLFAKPLFFLVQSSAMPYEKALQLANRTTRNILTVVSMAVAVAFVSWRALLTAREMFVVLSFPLVTLLYFNDA